MNLRKTLQVPMRKARKGAYAALLAMMALAASGSKCLASHGFNLSPNPTNPKPSIEIPSKELFNFTTNFTLEAWVRVTAFNTNGQAILTKGDTAWGLARFENTERVSFRTFNGVSMGELPSQSDFKPDVWHHVAAVYDGSRKSLYVDGQLEASVSYTSPVAVNEYPVLIGRNAQNAGRNFNGAIDAVRIWSLPRSQPDIISTTNRFLRGSEIGLVGAWDFEDVTVVGENLFTPDAGLNALNGALIQLRVAQQIEGITMLPPLSGEFALRLDITKAQKGASLYVPNTPELRFTNQMTFETWMQVDSFADSEDWTTLALGYDKWFIQIGNKTGSDRGKIKFTTQKSGAWSEVISKAALPDREWHHLAVVANSTSRAIYIDGKLDNFITNALPEIDPVLTPFGSMSIGFELGPPLNARVDDVRVWNKARSGELIANNFYRKLNGNEPGLGLWLDFNEGSGSLIGDKRAKSTLSAQLFFIDASRNYVDGVPLQEATSSLYSLYFNGATDYAEIPQPTNGALLKFTNLTIEAWIKPQANPTDNYKTNGFRNIAVKEDNGYGIALDDTNHLCFWIGAGSPGLFVKSGFTVTNDVWQHIAVVVDTIRNQTVFYLNGISDPVADVVPGIAIVRNEPGPIILGRQGSSPANYYKGWLAELRLWQSARSAQEINLLHANTLPAGSKGLGGYWDFSDGQGQTITDKSGNNLNGSLLMAPTAWDYSAQFDSLPLPPGLNLSRNPLAAGLWVGQINISGVSEVQTAIRKETKVTPTAEEASLRILLHVDAAGAVRLLKDVTLMRREATNDNPGSIVLVTDPSQLAQFQGIVKRNGKWVGKRLTAAAYDFEGESLELAGGIGPGVGCKGSILLKTNAPTNPFRHRYNPQLSNGYEITREIALTFPDQPPGTFTNGSPTSVDSISGNFQETITGLHKIPLVAGGNVILHRLSTTASLNQ